jgi:glucose-1-phosphate thymidylyltransferase
MIEAGTKIRVRAVDVWEDCGKPETVLHTNRYLLMNGHDNSADIRTEQFIVVPPVNIDPSAAIINSVVGPYVTIAENCRIERSIVRNSIIEAGAVIHDTTLDESLIGKEAYVAGRYRRLNVGDSASVDFS